ncbi:MAG: 1-aminocyclopropane-1-carboxylate deaminase/D-cysteine desulfhydrase [Promethearchaeota archaeon]
MNDNEEKEFPILLQKYKGLKNLPWIKLTELPTPIKKLQNLASKIGVDSLYIKQDDICNPVYGGNKPRKFEFVLADILKKNRRNIITMGGTGTNHGLAQTILCRQVEKMKNIKLNSYVFMFDQTLTEHVRKNLLLEQYYGSKLIYCNSMISCIFKMLFKYIFTPKCYFVWPGASRPLGTIGFVNAAYELKSQIDEGIIPEPDYIFVPVGSTGTSAGLLLGCELLNLKTKIYGVAVTELQFSSAKKVVDLAYNTWKFMIKNDKNIPIINKKSLFRRLIVNTNFFGGAYGLPTKEGIEAIKLLKETENLDFEPTYTGKTLAALIDFVQKNKNDLKEKTILYWNTLNSRKHDKEIQSVDYHSLPRDFHKYFDGTIPLFKF